MTFRKVRSIAHLALGFVALGCAAEETLVLEADAGRAPPDTGPAVMDVPVPTFDVGPLDRPAAEVATEPTDAGPDAPEVSRAMFCEGSGPPVTVGPPGAMRCAGRLAETVFRYSLCSCSNLGLAGFLRTDSYDSARGMMGRERGGAVGVNGNYTIVGYSQIGDTLTSSGIAPLRLVGAHNLDGDFNLGGPLEVVGTLDVARNSRIRSNITALGPMRVRGDLLHQSGALALGVIRVDGRRSSGAVTVDPPCACGAGEIFDVAAAVRDAQARNDNADAAFDPTRFNAVLGRQVTTLPCGRFYADRVAGLGSIELRVEGRTALFIGGDFDLGGFFDVQLGPRGELDVFIAGSVLGAGYLRMGGASRPSGVRIYIGGDRGFTLLGASRFVGNVYAPRAAVTIAGYMNLHGALFAQNIITGGDLDVHYDRSILRAGDDCPEEPMPTACRRCGSCRASQACVGGACGVCRTDADCCEPLVCATATGRCESIPP
jgi:hypothetical protein